MIPKSIRWRLPLSYAAIALLATLSLGIVLLPILRSFYRQQELDYLTNNARAISMRLAPSLEAGLPPEAIQSQLNSFAFLSQTRVRVLDPNGQALADSGTGQEQQDVLALSFETNVEIEADTTAQTLTQTVALSDQAQNYTSYFIIRNVKDGGGSHQLKDTLPYVDVRIGKENIPLKETVTVTATDRSEFKTLLWHEAEVVGHPPFISSILPMVSTPYGFEFRPAQASDGQRSDEVVSESFYDSQGALLGYVELSNGPAYGRQILRSVMWGWVMASGIAVLLATGVGWGISRRISRPLVALTNVTNRMAQEDLSIRAEVASQDELGSLAHSFNDMADRLEETIVTLRRFVADAAHELHTPLTALRTNLELAADKNDDNRFVFFERAQVQAERLEMLTSGLLDLSRLEASPVAPNKNFINLVSLLQDTSEGYASQAEQAGLSFAIDLPHEIISVQGNELYLRRVLDNLFDNALKFTPAGGMVKLGLRHIPDDRAELWLEDTGIGIPVYDLPHLFSRFHRGGNVAAYPGSGLGLAIVKAIVAGHGGQVSAKNTLQGAYFSFWLPSTTGQGANRSSSDETS